MHRLSIKKSLHKQICIHCRSLNAKFECNDIVIFIYSHYPLDRNAKSSDTKCVTLSIKYFCIGIKRVMTVYENYNVIAFRNLQCMYKISSNTDPTIAIFWQVGELCQMRYVGFIWVCTDSTRVFEIGGFYLDFVHFTNLVQSSFTILFGVFSRTENILT